ncbi:MAG: hypothetical protein ABIA59_10970 [Candidatus Latescibacterota bacterium]
MQKHLYKELKSLTSSIVEDTERVDTAARLEELGYPASATLAATFEKLARKFCPGPSAIELYPVIIADFLNAAYPQGALMNLLRYAENTAMPGVLLATLAQAGPLREILAATFGSSQYMADIIIRNPGYLYWLIEQRTWDTEDSVDRFETELEHEVSLFHSKEGKLNAVRRYHRKALLRIGVQDLLGQRTIESTTARLSDLADAIIRTLLVILWQEQLDKHSQGVAPNAQDSPVRGLPEPGCGFAVIALGKLGSRELNYSSDIDLIYLCADVDDAAKAFFHYFSQSLTEALSEISSEGYLYRVDLRLRPDGKSGPLVNTITSMHIYYETRGKPWEFQAMLKARVVAGDDKLGGTFITNVSKLIFNPTLSYSPKEDIAQMRERIQENIPLHERPFNIKLMEGGIRDIEFIVQTLQLIHIPQHPDIRVTGTLLALERIQKHRLLDKTECDTLQNAYRFLRLVEHRLQMMHQIKTHTVPESSADVALLAARVSKGPLGIFSYDDFILALTTHLQNVRILSDSFFSASSGQKDSLIFLLPEESPKARAILEQHGITDAESAIKLIHTMAYGSFPRLLDRNTRIALADLLPHLLASLSASGDPGLTLANISRIAAASRNENTFYRLLHGSEGALALTGAIAGVSSRLTGALCNHIELMDALLLDPQQIIHRSLHVAPGWDQLTPAGGNLRAADEEAAASLKRQLKQTLDHLHLAAFIADVPDGTVPSTLAHSRTTLARNWIGGAADSIIGDSTNCALFTMGSFAAGEPRFTSDIDLLFVTQSNDVETITRKIHGLNRVISESGLFKLDFRLRGEGANAPLVQNLEFYMQYFQERMSLWERVAFSKCSCWWGSTAIAGSIHETLAGILATPFSRQEIDSLVTMRHKLETLADRRPDSWETKRSPGGRYDIEYICAIGIAQTAGRAGYPFSASSEERIRILQSAGLLTGEESTTLIEASALFTRLEYILELQGFSLPHSQERDSYIEQYTTRTFSLLGLPVSHSAKKDVISAKQKTRRIFERFIAELT